MDAKAREESIAALNRKPPPLPRGDILRIDHVCVRVPDLEQGVAWYTTILGLIEIERRRGRVYLGTPIAGRHAIALAEGGTGMDYVSFAVNGPDALQRLGAVVDGLNLATADPGADARTGALSALRFKLPSGHLMELAVVDADQPRERPPPAPGMLDLKISHIQLRAGDMADIMAILSALGFSVSDHMRMSGGGYSAIFTRVNEFHHQIALLNGNPGFHHVALETEAMDIFKLCDHLMLHRVAAEYGPGRHGAGRPIFLYVRDPWGNRVELCSPIAMVGFNSPPRELADPMTYIVNLCGPQPPDSWRNEVT